MNERDRFVAEAIKLAALAVRSAREGRRIARRRKRGQWRLLRRTVFTGLALMLSVFTAIPVLFVASRFMSQVQVELFMLTMLLVSWTLIVYFGLFRRPRPVALPAPTTALAALPERTDAWLEVERAGLPWAAQHTLDAISARLEALKPRLVGVSEDRPAVAELRKLLGADLPQLVTSFRKLPASVTQQATFGGSTPERQLVDGLATIDRALARIEGELAQDDMRALATQQRYLDLKYNRKDGLDQ